MDFRAIDYKQELFQPMSSPDSVNRWIFLLNVKGTKRFELFH